MISVVIPLYNKEQSVVATIESILSQTYKNWELIVVDDGSTDNSLAVVQELLSKYQKSSVRLLHQSNAGVSTARNKGIMEAQGEYVAFLDADDYWKTDFLERMVQLMADYPNKSIYGLGCVPIDGSNNPKRVDGSRSYYCGPAGWDWDKMAFTGSSSCVRRADAISVGLFDPRMTHGEDLDMWWRLMLLNGGACDTRPYAYYCQNAENRAMHHAIPLEKHIPYYMEKFNNVRAANADFRRFFDREMIYRLYPYMFDVKYRAETKRIASQFDYSLQKKSMKWRMQYPHLYRFYQKLVGR